MINLLANAVIAASALSPDTLPADSLLPQRRKATEVSEWYQVRLTVHRVGAFAELPLFAAQYVVGQRLYKQTLRSESLSGLHSGLAASMGVLFTSNTITGAWNLWDSRAEPKGRTRRIIHAVIMTAAAAGFLATAALADERWRPGWIEQREPASSGGDRVDVAERRWHDHDVVVEGLNA